MKKTVSQDDMSYFGISKVCSWYQCLSRPDVSFERFKNHSFVSDYDSESLYTCLVEIKYHGYLNKQRKSIDKLRKADFKVIPKTLDYDQIHGLKKESRDKLKSYQPVNFGEAKKIAGVNPADLSVLLAYMNRS